MAPLMTATLPLQSCRMLASLIFWNQLESGHQAVNDDGTWFGTAVETNAAPGAVLPGVACGMNSERAQLGGEFKTSRRTRLHAPAATGARVDVDGDSTAWDCWDGSPRCQG